MKEFLKNQEKELILAAYERFHTVRKASAYLGMSMPTYVRKRRKRFWMGFWPLYPARHFKERERRKPLS